MKSLIIIPAYNEEKNIPTLIEKVKQLPYDYVVINDCSTD
ncbi:MAG: glycosyltransferase, partial [Erysipelotrichaceae bacterium]|nr:glycosyltransferase [Erysipelotrichaceae bacterium]